MVNVNTNWTVKFPAQPASGSGLSASANLLKALGNFKLGLNTAPGAVTANALLGASVASRSAAGGIAALPSFTDLGGMDSDTSLRQRAEADPDMAAAFSADPELRRLVLNNPGLLSGLMSLSVEERRAALRNPMAIKAMARASESAKEAAANPSPANILRSQDDQRSVAALSGSDRGAFLSLQKLNILMETANAQIASQQAAEEKKLKDLQTQADTAEAEAKAAAAQANNARKDAESAKVQLSRIAAIARRQKIDLAREADRANKAAAEAQDKQSAAVEADRNADVAQSAVDTELANQSRKYSATDFSPNAASVSPVASTLATYAANPATGLI